MNYKQLASIHETAIRCRAEGYDISEYAIRKLVSTGELSSVKVGNKSLIYWGNLMDFIKMGNSGSEESKEPHVKIHRIPI